MQDELFAAVGGPVIESALNGYNSTVFAYGQVKQMPAVEAAVVSFSTGSDLVHQSRLRVVLRLECGRLAAARHTP